MRLIRNGWEKRTSSNSLHIPKTCWHIEVDAGCIDFVIFFLSVGLHGIQSMELAVLFSFACYI